MVIRFQGSVREGQLLRGVIEVEELLKECKKVLTYYDESNRSTNSTGYLVKATRRLLDKLNSTSATCCKLEGKIAKHFVLWQDIYDAYGEENAIDMILESVKKEIFKIREIQKDKDAKFHIVLTMDKKEENDKHIPR